MVFNSCHVMFFIVTVDQAQASLGNTCVNVNSLRPELVDLWESP